MNERIVRLCPYRNCGWEFEEPPLAAVPDLEPEEQLRRHVRAVEEVLRVHLDTSHDGWTLEEVERESLQAQVRAVFAASPFSPTWPRR